MIEIKDIAVPDSRTASGKFRFQVVWELTQQQYDLALSGSLNSLSEFEITLKGREAGDEVVLESKTLSAIGTIFEAQHEAH